MLNGEEIYVGAPDSIRDYHYIDGHAKGYLLAMTVPEARGEVFNIAGGRPYTNKEWTLKIAKIIGFPEEKLHFGKYPPEYPYRPLASDQPYLVLNSDKAKKILGWEEKISPDEGLKITIDFWKQKLGK